MRLARLELDRYGRFTNKSLLLDGACDFYVIYGPNEAGKTTVRDAVVDLLYGIPVRSPYAFDNIQYLEMKLSARVESADDSMDVVRWKRNKNPLVDAADLPIDAGRWARLLGATDRPFFERMFALGHEQLIAGGRSMLDANTDASRAVFQAAAGLGRFTTVRSELEREAGQCWGARLRKDMQFQIAKTRLADATRTLKASALSEGALRSLQRESTKAEQRVTAASRAHVTAQSERLRLERIQRVGPKLQQLMGAEKARAELGSVVHFPANARTTYQTYVIATATAESAIRQIEDTLHGLNDQHGKLAVDPALLECGNAIDALVEQLSSVEAAENDLPARQLERDRLQSLIERSLIDLGLKPMEPAEVLLALPTLSQRDHLRELAGIDAGRERRLVSGQERQRAASLKIGRLNADLAKLGSSLHDGWGQLIDSAQDVLNQANAGQLAVAVTRAEEVLRKARLTLGWSDSLEMLEALRPPADAVIVARLKAIDGHQACVADVARERRAAAGSLAQRG